MAHCSPVNPSGEGGGAAAGQLALIRSQAIQVPDANAGKKTRLRCCVIQRVQTEWIRVIDWCKNVNRFAGVLSKKRTVQFRVPPMWFSRQCVF